MKTLAILTALFFVGHTAHAQRNPTPPLWRGQASLAPDMDQAGKIALFRTLNMCGGIYCENSSNAVNLTFFTNDNTKDIVILMETTKEGELIPLVAQFAGKFEIQNDVLKVTKLMNRSDGRLNDRISIEIEDVTDENDTEGRAKIYWFNPRIQRFELVLEGPISKQ